MPAPTTSRIISSTAYPVPAWTMAARAARNQQSPSWFWLISPSAGRCSNRGLPVRTWRGFRSRSAGRCLRAPLPRLFGEPLDAGVDPDHPGTRVGERQPATPDVPPERSHRSKTSRSSGGSSCRASCPLPGPSRIPHRPAHRSVPGSDAASLTGATRLYGRPCPGREDRLTWSASRRHPPVVVEGGGSASGFRPFGAPGAAASGSPNGGVGGPGSPGRGPTHRTRCAGRRAGRRRPGGGRRTDDGRTTPRCPRARRVPGAEAPPPAPPPERAVARGDPPGAGAPPRRHDHLGAAAGRGRRAGLGVDGPDRPGAGAVRGGRRVLYVPTRCVYSRVKSSTSCRTTQRAEEPPRRGNITTTAPRRGAGPRAPPPAGCRRRPATRRSARRR